MKTRTQTPVKSQITLKRAEKIFESLKLLQKEMRGYEGVVYDLATQARANRRALHAILERPDMKNY